MNRSDFELELIKNDSIIRNIRNEASCIHDVDANQKYGIFPYSVHLDAVADNVIKFGSSVISSPDDILPVIFAAYFHDSIEDARLSYDDVLRRAQNNIPETDGVFLAADIVYALTNEKGKTREERESDSYFTGLFITKYSPFVKACDRLANLTSSYFTKNESPLFDMYVKEMPRFLDSINRHVVSSEFSIPEELVETLKKLSELE